MGLPGHRRTSSHKRRRASHFALKKSNLSACKNCGQTVVPHRACTVCGVYEGRQVLNVARANKRLAAKKLAKTPEKETVHKHEEEKAEPKK
jgi:large subunit ribosomal protein L32